LWRKEHKLGFVINYIYINIYIYNYIIYNQANIEIQTSNRQNGMLRFKQPKWEFKWISSAEVRIAMAFKTTGFLGSWRGQTQKSHGKKRVQRWT
jgi:hypothetical protein